MHLPALLLAALSASALDAHPRVEGRERSSQEPIGWTGRVVDPEGNPVAGAVLEAGPVLARSSTVSSRTAVST